MPEKVELKVTVADASSSIVVVLMAATSFIDATVNVKEVESFTVPSDT